MLGKKTKCASNCTGCRAWEIKGEEEREADKESTEGESRSRSQQEYNVKELSGDSACS